jgi:hypothetical protein
LTLRELSWAANARQQSEWVRGAVLTAAAANANTFSSKLDPAKLVPECYRGDEEQQPRGRPRTAEEEAAESEIAWRLLGQGLRA